jgi:hypothetical protein
VPRLQACVARHRPHANVHPDRMTRTLTTRALSAADKSKSMTVKTYVAAPRRVAHARPRLARPSSRVPAAIRVRRRLRPRRRGGSVVSQQGRPPLCRIQEGAPCRSPPRLVVAVTQNAALTCAPSSARTLPHRPRRKIVGSSRNARSARSTASSKARVPGRGVAMKPHARAVRARPLRSSETSRIPMSARRPRTISLLRGAP